MNHRLLALAVVVLVSPAFALDGDPLEFTTAVRWVMIDGKIVEGEGESI